MRWLCLLLLLLVIVGCGPRITNGKITTKYSVPAYETTVYWDCGSGITVPMTTQHPETWYFVFSNVVEGHGEVSRTVQVSQANFNAIVTGTWYEEPQRTK